MSSAATAAVPPPAPPAPPVGSLGISFGPPSIQPEEVELGEKLGEGSFGVVYSGTCRQQPVAIKVLHNQNLDQKTIEAFRKEVEIMCQIPHPNVAQFLGACTLPGHLMIVTELLPRGDLSRLMADPRVALSLLMRMRMALDSARGMTWLHESTPPFIHRDLKPSNLLVAQDFSIKVADFGLSQVKAQEYLKDRGDKLIGTPLYMAPEVLNAKAFNEKADVYSFGVMLWEMVARKDPFGNVRTIQELYDYVVKAKGRMPIPADCPESLRALISDCWADAVDQRPSFRDVVNRLHEVIVDCAVRDATGRTLWKEKFLTRSSVPWNDFWNAIGEFLPMQTVSSETNAANLLTLLASHASNERGKISVDLERWGELLEWLGPFDRDLLERISALCALEWFHGNITKKQADERLTSVPPGTFLVRFSTDRPGSFTVSWMRADHEVRHIRVERNPDGFHAASKVYASLQDVVADHKDALVTPCAGSPFFSKAGQYDILIS